MTRLEVFSNAAHSAGDTLSALTAMEASLREIMNRTTMVGLDRNLGGYGIPRTQGSGYSTPAADSAIARLAIHADKGGHTMTRKARSMRFEILGFTIRREANQLTRKDYVAIAEALRFAMFDDSEDGNRSVEWHEAAQAGIGTAAHFIANAMQDDNPRFDREHFLAVVRGERKLNSRPKRAGRGA